MLYGGGTPWQVGCFWRKGIYQEVGGIRSDLRYAADYDFFLRLCLKGSSYYAKKVFGAHRHHQGQLSIAGSSKYEDERREVRLAAVESVNHPFAMQLLLRSIFLFNAKVRGRLSLFLSNHDSLRGAPLSKFRCE